MKKTSDSSAPGPNVNPKFVTNRPTKALGVGKVGNGGYGKTNLGRKITPR